MSDCKVVKDNVNEQLNIRTVFFPIALLAGGIISTTILPYTATPIAGQPVGIVFPYFSDGDQNVKTVLRVQKTAQLVETRYGGWIVYVVSDDNDYSNLLERTGAWHVFDAVAAGCHSG